jgi:hypothetical protein
MMPWMGFLWFCVVVALVIAAVALGYALKNRHNGSSRSSEPPRLYAFTTPGTYSFRVPRSSDGNASMILFGAGGGGAGAVTGAGPVSQFGGGGGGGAYIQSRVRVKPGSTLTVVVGAGGTGGAAETTVTTGINAGGNGGSTSVSGLLGSIPVLSAGGGAGSPGLSSSALPDIPNVGTGGVPVPATALFPGFVAYSGQNGGLMNAVIAGDGGAAPQGGAGGLAGLEEATAIPANGGTGLQPGGGGGGGATNSAGAQGGGAGASGAVYIYI